MYFQDEGYPVKQAADIATMLPFEEEGGATVRGGIFLNDTYKESVILNDISKEESILNDVNKEEIILNNVGKGKRPSGYSTYLTRFWASIGIDSPLP